VTTSDNPNSQDPHARRPEEQTQPQQPEEQRAEAAEQDATSVSPQDALKDLGQQPRIDEQGHPTAYTAVPPPLGQQPQSQQPQQPTWQPPSDAQQPGYGHQPANGQQPGYSQPQQDPYATQQPPYDQPPVYGQPPTYGQPPSYASAEQGPGQGQQQGQPGQQQPGFGYPPPPPPEYGAPQQGGGQYGVTGQPPGIPPYASWGQRAGAWLIDNIAALIGIGLTEASYYDWATGARVISWIIAVAGVVWAVYNAYLAGQTGQSTGKRLVGIRLARYADGQVVGPAYGILRLFMNVVFWVICFIPGVLNYLWPLWDPKSQTWSDKIASSVVVQTR